MIVEIIHKQFSDMGVSWSYSKQLGWTRLKIISPCLCSPGGRSGKKQVGLGDDTV